MRVGAAAAAMLPTHPHLISIVTIVLLSLDIIADAHGTYGVCSLAHCVCSNVTGSLDCSEGHDLSVHSLLQVPRTYQHLAIDGFLVADVLDGGELSSFKQLVSLKLTRCRIERVGEGALAGLGGSLQTLSLAGNHIRQLGAGALSSLRASLVSLDLSGNQLRELAPGLLASFERLEELNLSGNKLRRLAADAFGSLGALQRLDLSANELAYVFPKAFEALVGLTFLNLQRNLLVTAQQGLIAGKPLLREALFGGNRFECSCGMQWLRDRLLAAGETATASSPLSSASFNRSAIVVLPTLCLADGVPLVNKSDDDLRCVEPIIEAVSAPLRTFQRNAFRLFCNATGHPQPAIVWRLPCGDYLADPAHGEWLTDEAHAFVGERTYYITATADELAFSLEPTWAADGAAADLNQHRQPTGYELRVSSLRRFSEGTYTCIAMNPAGNVSTDVVVTMVAPIGDVYVPSLIFGAGATSAGSLLAGVLGCLVQRACRSRRKRKYRKRAAKAAERGSQRISLLGSTGGMSSSGGGVGGDDPEDGGAAAGARKEAADEAGPSAAAPLLQAGTSGCSGTGGHHVSSDDEDGADDGDYEDDEDGDSSDNDNAEDDCGSGYASEEDDAAESYDTFAVSTAEGSPRRRGGTASPHESSPARASASRTRETLGAAKVKLRSRVDRMDTMKVKLRLNMEKKAERVKVQMEKRAERMRNNMEKHRERMRDTLINIRESTSHSLQSIRDTSSSYAHKLHVGMRNAMENVGYTVQSLKELCGAGDLGLTMSVATIATNVDTEEQVEVVRNVTLV